MYYDQLMILLFKLVLVIYMLMTPYMNNDFIIYTFDNKFFKIFFIIIVIMVSYYDNGLGILLTLSYILSINYNLPNYRQYKKVYKKVEEEDINEQNFFNINLNNDSYYKYDINY